MAAAMSAALAVLGSLACLLVTGLLLSLAYLARVERKHEEAVGVRTADRPTHAGKSGDIHLFLGFPAAVELDAPFVSDARSIASGESADLLRSLASKLGSATHGHAEFGQFRPISVRAVEGVSIVYVHARTRKPVATFVELGSRARHATTLESLVSLAPAGIIELDIGRAAISSDPALGRPVALH